MSELHKFLFEGLPVRGMLVRLTDSWQEVLRRHAQSHHPLSEPTCVLMGEMAAAAVLMQANINFQGALVLQISGDGPVKLAVAEVQSDLSFRVMAQEGSAVPLQGGLEALVNVRGQGRCAITLDPKSRMPGQQPYQGVVSLHGDQREPLQQLSQVLEHYMLQSEQLDTRLILAANSDIAAGILIQRLPVQGAGNVGAGLRNEDHIRLSEAYNRIAHLAATLSQDELLQLDADTVLRRLFWEETMQRFAPLGPRFECTCGRERVGSMLQSLGQPEVMGIIREQGQVEVACEFCAMQYRFDAIEADALFIAPLNQPPGSLALN
jgi:molecular chaperone Hsp33